MTLFLNSLLGKAGHRQSREFFKSQPLKLCDITSGRAGSLQKHGCGAELPPSPANPAESPPFSLTPSLFFRYSRITAFLWPVERVKD